MFLLSSSFHSIQRVIDFYSLLSSLFPSNYQPPKLMDKVKGREPLQSLRKCCVVIRNVIAKFFFLVFPLYIHRIALGRTFLIYLSSLWNGIALWSSFYLWVKVKILFTWVYNFFWVLLLRYLNWYIAGESYMMFWMKTI